VAGELTGERGATCGRNSRTNRLSCQSDSLQRLALLSLPNRVCRCKRPRCGEGTSSVFSPDPGRRFSSTNVSKELNRK